MLTPLRGSVFFAVRFPPLTIISHFQLLMMSIAVAFSQDAYGGSE
jgi:hypothetical protein